MNDRSAPKGAPESSATTTTSIVAPGVVAILDRLTDPVHQLLDEAKELADDLGGRLVDKDELLKGQGPADNTNKHAYDLSEAFWAACRLEKIIDELRRHLAARGLS
jgi:hypothetical protein